MHFCTMVPVASAPSLPIGTLTQIPGVGKSIAADLHNIGIFQVQDLVGRNPEDLYAASNQYAGHVQDRCLLYVFRCAVYYAETRPHHREPEKLRWWYWKDRKQQ